MSESSHPPASAEDAGPLGAFDPGRLDPDPRSMTRIVLRPIGSPLPLGFFTLAIDSVLVSALQWGSLTPADSRAVALVVFPAFVPSRGVTPMRSASFPAVRRLRRLHAHYRLA